jgi:hypothetical protein
MAAASPGLAGDSVATSKAALQNELQRLEKRLNALEAKRARARRIERRVAAAAAVEAGAKRRSWKLPGTNTSMQIGGFAQLSLIYDINHSSGDAVSSNGASGASFPSSGTAAANRQGQFRLHARRSRFFIRTWTPTDYGTLHTRMEGDFMGAGGNQLISNSNSFRLRHAYGSLGPVLAGQTYSTFRFTKFEMFSFQDRGLAANGNGRQGLIRYTHKFGGGTALIIAVENPETNRAIVSGTYVDPVVISGGGAPDRMPEFVAALQHVWSSGRVKFGAVFGEEGIDDGGGSNDFTFVWAVQGGLKIKFNNKRTEFSILGFFGEGMGKYWRGMPGSIAVTGVNGGNVQVKAIRSYGGYAWLRHKWTDTISTNVGFGRHDADVEGHIAKVNIPARALDVHWSFLANIVWTPVSNVLMGVEYHWLRSNYHNALSSVIHRVQFSARYKF